LTIICRSTFLAAQIFGLTCRNELCGAQRDSNVIGSAVADLQNSVLDRLRAAAAALTGAAKTPDAINLLAYLGYELNADAVPGRVLMLQAASTFRRLFRLPMPDAPGLTFFGAEADPADLGPHNKGLPTAGFAGSGLEPRQAFESCVGEGIEYLSQFAQPDDSLEAATIELFGRSLDPVSHRFVQTMAAACDIPADRAVNWIPIRRLADGAASWFPADLCLRRAARDFVPPLKLSTGCAAGVTLHAATLRGMLELIERDAVALWWRGGRRPSPVDPDSEAGTSAVTLLAQARQNRSDRLTSLLDITTDLGIPVVAAFSTQPDGHGFALGLGARISQTDAARAAISEMCQSELSLHVIAAKQRQSGPAALNESDKRQLNRAALLSPLTCPLLQPLQKAAAEPSTLSGDPVEAITCLLAKHGIVAYSLDLTRLRFGIPVIRVIAPGLQSDPSEIVTDRLACAIQETGGGAKHSHGVVLL
jgi:ribosomal protein S12 methylthiotransferase accessory factor